MELKVLGSSLPSMDSNLYDPDLAAIAMEIHTILIKPIHTQNVNIMH